MAKVASVSDVLADIYRDAVADALPDTNLHQADTALLHWRLSLALNAATVITAPDLTRSPAALVLRQAKVNRTGALLRRSLMVVDLGWDGVVAAGRLVAPSAEVFAEDAALRRFLDQPDPPLGRGDEIDDEERALRSWRPIEPDRGTPWTGVVALDLLPGCAWGRRQMEERCRHAARRIARESRILLFGEPPRPSWGQRGGVEEDPGLRRLVATLAMTAFAVLRGTTLRALDRFAALLDAEAVAALGILPAPRVEHYNFFAAPQQPACQPRRLQALATYPLLADALAARPELGEVIDLGRELGAALCRTFNAKPAALKTLVGLPPATLGDDGTLPDAARLLTALSAVPPAWHPRTPEAWRAFRRLLSIPAHAPPVTWDVGRMRELGPDWSRSLERLGGFQRLADLKDFRWALVSHVLTVPFQRVEGWHVSRAVPDTLRTLADVLGTLLDRRPLLQQIDASERWHRRQGEILDITGASDGWRGQLRWLPLTEPYHSRRGPVVVPLVSGGALRDEGDKMHHCVGWYDDRCCYDGHHILAIRDADGARLSTAELRFDDDGDLVVLQHRAAFNERPTDDAAEALEEYLDGIASGDIPCDRKALDEAMAHRRSTRRNRDATGLDGRDPATIAAVWQVYRALLPSPWRRMTVEKFHQASGLAAAVAAEQAVPFDQRPQPRQEEYWENGRRKTRTTLPWYLWPGTEDLWRALLAADMVGDAATDVRLLAHAFDAMPSTGFRWNPEAAVVRDEEESIMAEWQVLLGGA